MDKRVLEMKKVVKKRLKINISMIIIFAIIFILSSQNENEIDFIRGYQNGVAFGLLLGSIINFIRNLYIQLKEERLLSRYIKEHDERNLFLWDKVGYNTFRIEVVVILAISVIVPLFYHDCKDILIGLVASIYILFFIHACMYFYYSKKF